MLDLFQNLRMLSLFITIVIHYGFTFNASSHYTVYYRKLMVIALLTSYAIIYVYINIQKPKAKEKARLQ